MTSQGGGGNGTLNPLRGSVVLRSRDLHHPTLRRTVATPVDRVWNIQKPRPQTLSLRLRVLCLIIALDLFPLSSPPADDQDHLLRLNPQTIQRQIRKLDLPRNSSERSVVCCLPEWSRNNFISHHLRGVRVPQRHRPHLSAAHLRAKSSQGGLGRVM